MGRLRARKAAHYCRLDCRAFENATFLRAARTVESPLVGATDAGLSHKALDDGGRAGGETHHPPFLNSLILLVRDAVRGEPVSACYSLLLPDNREICSFYLFSD